MPSSGLNDSKANVRYPLLIYFCIAGIRSVSGDGFLYPGIPVFKKQLLMRKTYILIPLNIDIFLRLLDYYKLLY